MVAALAELPHTHQPAMEKFESDAIFFITQAQVCMRFCTFCSKQCHYMNNGQLKLLFRRL
jgi:uncharacterized protein YuzB (UPF0349 family)